MKRQNLLNQIIFRIISLRVTLEHLCDILCEKSNVHSSLSRNVPGQFLILQTIGGMGTSFWRNDISDSLGGQALIMIGYWLP